MNIKTVVVGDLETNCYILEKDNEVIIIDPGDEFPKIKKEVGDKKVVACLLTHNHFDHIGALEEVLSYYDVDLNKYNGKNFKFEILETPGHTFDSRTFYFKDEGIMFDGDFIFNHGIGRTDLGGNNKDMIESLEYIKTFDENIKLYPGHGPITTIKEEKGRFSLYY